MYRFLLTPRWLGLVALMLALAAAMVALGWWQLNRYHERSAVNDRIDAASSGAATPLAQALPAPGGTAGQAGPAPPAGAAWTRVTVTGRYDPANQVLVRGRTVADRVGYEVVTPLVLADGTAVLVDRGWVPPARGGASAVPDTPPAPTGLVRVEGRVHLTESRPGPITRQDSWIEVRRITVDQIAGELPYPVYGAYLLLDTQDPPADPALSPVPVRHENSWQNAGYAVQWWLFAGLALAALVWLARREAHPPGPRTDRDAPALPGHARSVAGTDRRGR